MDFDRYRDDYEDRVSKAIAWSGTEQEFYLRTKAGRIAQLAEERLAETPDLSVLDVGCGVGLIDAMLAKRFRRLIGVDVALGALAQARRNAPEARFVGYDGSLLPFANGTFDLVFAVCVVHHVAPEGWPRFASELARVTRPGGLVMIFEHNPLNPLTRIAVSRCEFDRNAVLLGRGRVRRLMHAAGLRHCEGRHILFFPWSGGFWAAIEDALGWLPLGAQYYVAAHKSDAAPY
jgi:SAM-dependent methyltransferase